MTTIPTENTQGSKELSGNLDARSRQLRATVIQTLHAGGRGHPAPALSVLEIVRVLYDSVLNIDPENPRMADRDRFILSKGHGCLAQYVLLADHGFFPKEELWEFCRAGAMLGGHPEYGKVPGVEASTGSLGHGLSIGCGFALNGRIDQLGYRVFVVMGDGESNEGSVWEAALMAGKHGLDNLTVIIDYNKLQSYGKTDLIQPLEPLADKWRAFGFAVTEVDGHDVGALEKTFQTLPLQFGKPNAVICHTVKGKGISFMEHNLAWHHKAKLTADELKAMASELGVAVEGLELKIGH